MTEAMNIRPEAESRFVEMTPAGLRRVRTWAVLITIGSFLFGYDTGNRLRHQVGAGNPRPTRNGDR